MHALSRFSANVTFATINAIHEEYVDDTINLEVDGNLSFLFHIEVILI